MMCKNMRLAVFMAFIFVLSTISAGCDKKEETLVVYAGKGLRVGVEDIVKSFEEKHKISVDVVYGGSQTILTVLKNTGKGDMFIPGDITYLKEAGEFIEQYQVIATHIPVVVVRVDNQKKIQSFFDLANPGVTLAIGNKNTCAIGAGTDYIFNQTGNKESYLKNVTIESPTANELLDMVIQKEVDATINFAHLLNLQKAEDLMKIEIPANLISPLEIPVAILNTSENKKNATLFANFAAKEGKQIFKKHGFGE